MQTESKCRDDHYQPDEHEQTENGHTVEEQCKESKETSVNYWEKVEKNEIDKLINDNNDREMKHIDSEPALKDNLPSTRTKPINDGSSNNNNWNESSAWSDKWQADNKDADSSSSDCLGCNGGRQRIQNLLQVPQQQTR